MPFGVTNLVGFGGKRAAAAGAGGATVSYGGQASDFSSNTSYTFSSQSFPDAETGRVCVVVISGESAALAVLSSVTIGGNTATITQNTVYGDRAMVAMAAYQMDSGTTADVVLNFDIAISIGVAISTYSLLGVDGVTASDSDFDFTDPSTGESTTVNIPAGSVAISVASNGNSKANTWSGATEEDDVNITHAQHSSASVAATGSARSTHVVSTSHDSAVAGGAMITAVWDAA